MTKGRDIATDAEIEAALQGARSLDDEPLARTVEHVQDLNLLIVGLSNGRRLILPVEDVQGLSEATHEQIARYELLGRGTGISFPDLDVDLYVPSLIKGIYGSQRWMAELGTRNCSSSTGATRETGHERAAEAARL